MQRLKKRADFLSVAKGVRAGRRAFTLQAAKRRPRLGANGKPIKAVEEPVVDARIGFTVTKKVGNAVVRNRIRRRLRAAVDRLDAAPVAADYDYVLVGRRDALALDFMALIADLRGALIQVHRSREPRGGAGSAAVVAPTRAAPSSTPDRAAGASPVDLAKADDPLTDAPHRAPSRTDR
jgi:ribonuclease P protein component